MRTNLIAVIVAVCISAIAGRTAYSVAPGYTSDYEMSRYPHIVLGQWEKAQMRPHAKTRGNVLEAYEVFTELKVARVIKGDVQPGRHPVLIRFGMGWGKDGTGLRTGTSTDIPGDVDDVAKPNIWFLTRSRSWDESDKTDYLCVPHYRAIQPAALEPYFKALSSSEHERSVPSLLFSDNPVIVKRVLFYICGGILPWPYEPEEWAKGVFCPRERERLLKGQAVALREGLLGDMPDHRHLAASVYAEIAGSNGVDFVTTLLSDRDRSVRAVAVGVLIRNRQEDSLPRLAPAIRDLDNKHLTCAVIREASSWGDHRLAPLLISFLQDDSHGDRVWTDVRIPALKAREALHDITDCWFPFNVARSQQVWALVDSLGSWEEKQRGLRSALPDEQCPLRAEFYGPLHDSYIRVVNVSKHPVAICRYPAWVDASTPNMVANTVTDYPEQGEECTFVTLEVGGSTVFPTKFGAHFAGVDPKALSLSLFYQDLPKDAGKTGWIGRVAVRVMEGRLGGTGKLQVPNYLVQCLKVTWLCSLPLGIAAIVYLVRVRRKARTGGIREGDDSSEKVEVWIWVSFGVGILAGAVYVMIMATGVAVAK